MKKKIIRTSNLQYKHNPIIHFHSHFFVSLLNVETILWSFLKIKGMLEWDPGLKDNFLMHSNINIVDISMLKIFYIWHTVFCKTIFSCQKNLQKRKAHTHKDRFYLHSLVFPFTSSFIGFISLLDGLNSNFRFRVWLIQPNAEWQG